MLLIIFILSALVAFKWVTDYVGRQSQSLARALMVGKSINGITVATINIKKAHVDPPATLVWQGVEATLKGDSKGILYSQKFRVLIPRLEIRVSDFIGNQCTLFASRIDIMPILTGGQTSSHPQKSIKRLENGRFLMDFKLNFFRPFSAKAQIISTLYNLSSFFSNGSTFVPVDFSGILHFTFNDEPIRARFFTKRRSNGSYALQINEEFFQTAAWSNNYKMTDAEAKILSEYPFRMPELVNIMAEAKQTSEGVNNIRDIPEDAYRHILWSYLLTRAYGPKFAKQVTDAHEIGDSSNTEAEHQMDYHNNAIGRKYAMSNYKKHELLRRLINDKNVIREPRN